MPNVIAPSPTQIPVGWRRDSTRPAELRDANFDEEHDGTTLFYDAFWSGSEVLLLGPPLNNLTSTMQDLRVVALPSGTPCTFRTRTLELHQQLWVSAPAGTSCLVLSTGMGEIIVAVKPRRASPLAGRRVLCTMSKDNELVWIEDWVRFHRDLHGADAVLVYDNASTAYAAELLQERLSALAGIAVAQVVTWPYRYGPQGFQKLGYWDSTYSQPGVFEHARWSLLAEARSVMNGDVDEVVHSRNGARLFEAVEASRFGVLRYNGLWMPTTDRSRVSADQPPRYRDFEHHLDPKIDWTRRPPRRSFSSPKWAVVPSRCPPRAQWQVHRVKRWPAAAVITPTFSYRHYRRLSNGWKYDRADAQAYDPAMHSYDAGLVRDYQRVRWDC